LGQALDTPSHVSAASHLALGDAARHTVPFGAKIVGHMADVPLHTSSRSHKPFDFKHSLPAGSNLHVAWLQHGARTSQSSPASTCPLPQSFAVVVGAVVVVVIVVVGTTDVVFVVDADVTILVVLGNLLVDDFVAIETVVAIDLDTVVANLVDVVNGFFVVETDFFVVVVTGTFVVDFVVGALVVVLVVDVDVVVAA